MSKKRPAPVGNGEMQQSYRRQKAKTSTAPTIAATPCRESFDAIEHAITLRGSQITEAILSGKKDIENRSTRLPTGCWIALHTGKGQIYDYNERAMIKFAPSDDGCCPADESQYPVGAVVGLCWISKTVTIEQLRKDFNCSEECAAAASAPPLCKGESKLWKQNGDKKMMLTVCHHKDCRLSPFAIGPVCNVISAVVRLPEPIPCIGNLNCWKMPSLVADQIKKQLAQYRPPICFTTMSLSPSSSPRPWPLPWCKEEVERDTMLLIFRAQKKKKEKVVAATKIDDDEMPLCCA